MTIAKTVGGDGGRQPSRPVPRTWNRPPSASTGV